MQEDLPIDEETYWLLTFLSDYGIWFFLAIALIIVFFYKKTKE